MSSRLNLHIAREPERVRPIWESGRGHIAMVTVRTVCNLQVTIRCITEGEPSCPECARILAEQREALRGDCSELGHVWGAPRDMDRQTLPVRYSAGQCQRCGELRERVLAPCGQGG